MTFDPHENSGGEPGEFYHVSDVKGKEDLIGVGGRTKLPTHASTAFSCAHQELSPVSASHGEAYVLGYRPCRPLRLEDTLLQKFDTPETKAYL